MNKKKYSGIVSGLFQRKKPSPDVFYNTGGRCGVLCDKNQQPVLFKYLTKEKPCKGYGYFEYVIRELEPYRIYVYHQSGIKSPTDTNLNILYKCGTKIETFMHHNCIALDRRVISAGTIEFFKSTRNVRVSNASGHYLPSQESLEWLIYLLELLNYKVTEISYF